MNCATWVLLLWNSVQLNTNESENSDKINENFRNPTLMIANQSWSQFS